jgi:hypothetical protein
MLCEPCKHSTVVRALARSVRAWHPPDAIRGPDDVAVRLSSGEHLLLVSFIEHAGLTLTRDQLLDLTRGREAQAFDRSIHNQVSRLRRKLEAEGQLVLEVNQPHRIDRHDSTAGATRRLTGAHRGLDLYQCEPPHFAPGPIASARPPYQRQSQRLNQSQAWSVLHFHVALIRRSSQCRRLPFCNRYKHLAIAQAVCEYPLHDTPVSLDGGCCC